MQMFSDLIPATALLLKACVHQNGSISRTGDGGDRRTQRVRRPMVDRSMNTEVEPLVLGTPGSFNTKLGS
jgi:hypothetical protein